MLEYIQHKYVADLSNNNNNNNKNIIDGEAREMVMVHTRFGGVSEINPGAFGARQAPPISWYVNVMLREFDVSRSVFYLFTDNAPMLERVVQCLKKESPGLVLRVIQEDFATELAIMSLCKHHVITMSTFGFWGAYLNKDQPHGGKTIIHTRYPRSHGDDSIPYAEWKRIGDEYNSRSNDIYACR